MIFDSFRIQRLTRSEDNYLGATYRPNIGGERWKVRHNVDRIFEVCIYNKEVRSLVKENQSHAFFDDHWADEQTRDVMADNADEARHLASTRFPPDEGFVITSVKPIVLH